MTARPLAAALLFSVAIGLGCAGLEQAVTPQPVPDDKRAYIGTWTDATVTLTIEPDGMCAYETQKGGGKSAVSAPIQLWHDKGFDMGIGPLVTTVSVSEAPHEIAGQWHMTVDGHDLLRN